MEKEQKIMNAWKGASETLHLDQNQMTAMDNLFAKIQEEFSFQENQFAMLKNSIRLVKTDRFDAPTLRSRKENYTYLDSTEAVVQIERLDLLTYLISTAEKAKRDGVPVLSLSDARTECAVESVNRVILAPGQYKVRFLMAIWDPHTSTNRVRALRCFFETENHDLFFVKILRNRKFDYYAPARQENMELKNSALWMKPMLATFSISYSSTFLQLDCLELLEEEWKEEV